MNIHKIVAQLSYVNSFVTKHSLCNRSYITIMFPVTNYSIRARDTYGVRG